MNRRWNLSPLYPGFDDPAFREDLQSLQADIAAFHAALREDAGNGKEKLEGLLARYDALSGKLDRVGSMIFLTLAVDAENAAANACMTTYLRAGKDAEEAETAFSRYLASLPDLPELLASSPSLSAVAFALSEMAEKAAHLLPPEMEKPILTMQLSGGEAFSQLRDKLDSTLLVDYQEEQLPLSAIRAKASDPDPDVRRSAYLAELEGYRKIELPMSYCLNAIKAEAVTLSRLKGYDSVLSMTLRDTRMSGDTLNVMWEAITEALPALRRYLKAKARLLGHRNGLPFYDLFAPVGRFSRTYSYEEAQKLLLDIFGSFAPEMRNLMAEAFSHAWIDVDPRPGKSGGAFCSGLYDLGESRVMTNFTGSLSDISTLAHELGHAFNDRQLQKMPRLLTSIPMQLAETASTFNEVFLSAAMRKNATPEEELSLLDAGLQESIQTLVDIRSRFLFESDVIEAQADHMLTSRELCDRMLKAQDATYGDGLDPDFRHPYMWACKSHYYSTGLHFYNFPYAFGTLFARGLYERWCREGADFVPVYCSLLARFGSGSVEEITRSVGIDVTRKDFWQQAVSGILSDVERFCLLAEGQA